jgi:hypothetical protein
LSRSNQPTQDAPQDDAPQDYERFFADLESRLASLSHTDEAVRVVESAVTGRFKKTSQRQVAFAFPGGVCVEPIAYDVALAAGKIGPGENCFAVLQGDVVSTEAAYFMGERLTGGPLFAILNSTCDLVPGRREYASLLRVSPINGSVDEIKSTLHQLLSFRSRRDLYLPSMPLEEPPSLGYAIRFDGVAQVRIEDLLVARRLCSLSLAGWRIFGSFARVLISRAGDGEAQLRTKLEPKHR